MTFPRRLRDNPAYVNYRSEGGRTLYGEDMYVGYRWYDNIELAPLFHFGHGLSYTTFAFSSLQLHQDSLSHLVVACDVRNVGSCEGAEVVQVYISPPQSQNVRRPVKELKGFSKVYLQPSEQRRVEIVLELQASTSYWDECEGMWCSEAGSYTVMVGNSSGAMSFLTQEFVIGKTSWWRGLK